jgi:hypothetical protein
MTDTDTSIDTAPTSDAGPSDFDATGVPSFDSGDDWSGSIPGDPIDGQTPGGPAATPSAIDALFVGVDMTDPAAKFPNEKVETSLVITAIEPFVKNGKVALIVKYGATAPAICVPLTDLKSWCVIANTATDQKSQEEVSKGKAELRAIAKACGKPLSAAGDKLANGQSIASLLGAAFKAKVSKGKKGGFFVNL